MPDPIRIFRIPGAPDPSAGLPKFETAGFADDFARPDADSLGVTTDGKPWEVLDTGTWGIRNGRAQLLSMIAPAVDSYAVVNAGSADGHLRAVIADPAHTSPAIVLRAVDRANHLFVSEGNGPLRLYARAGGTSTVLKTPASGTPLMTAGAVVDVILDGASITVSLNGAEILTHTTTQYQTATRYGFRGISGDGLAYQWDSIQLTV